MTFKKKWFVINDKNEIISKIFDTKVEAFSFWTKLNGEGYVCETIWG